MDLDTKRNRNREGLRALQKDLSLSGKPRLPHCSPGGLFTSPSKAFDLPLIETRQEARGVCTAHGDGETVSQFRPGLWLRILATHLRDRLLAAGL